MGVDSGFCDYYHSPMAQTYLGGGGGGGGGYNGYIFLWVVSADNFQIIWVVGVCQNLNYMGGWFGSISNSMGGGVDVIVFRRKDFYLPKKVVLFRSEVVPFLCGDLGDLGDFGKSSHRKTPRMLRQLKTWSVNSPIFGFCQIRSQSS